MGWTGTIVAGRTGLALCQLLILTRVLPPETLGLIAIVLAVHGLASGVADFGLGPAIIHLPDPNKTQSRRLLAMAMTRALVTGGTALALIAVMAPMLPEALAPMLAVSVLGVVLAAPALHWRAYGEKAMLFKRLAIIELAAASASFAVMLLALLAGLKEMAVPLGLCAAGALQSLLAWRWIGTRRAADQGTGDGDIAAHQRLARAALAISLANGLGQHGDVLAAGRFLSAAQLGLLYPARELSLRISLALGPVVTRVGFPMLAKSHGRGESLGTPYAQALALSLCLTLPFYAAIIAFAAEVAGALGMTDPGAPALLQAAALWGALRAMGNPAGTLLLASGNARLALVWSGAVALAVPLAAAWGALAAGSIGVPLALAALYGALILPGWAFVVRPVSGLRLSGFLAAIAFPALASASAAVIAYGATLFMPSGLTRLAIGLTIGFSVYLAIGFRALKTRSGPRSAEVLP